MKLANGNKIQVLFSDQTAGDYGTLEEAEYAIAANVTGEMMGPHGHPATPIEMYEVDAQNKRIRALHIRATVEVYAEGESPTRSLKAVLMELGNRLVMQHRFDPSPHVGVVLPSDASTAPIKLFTEFVNSHPEAQEILKELGFAWPIVQRPHGPH